jgi:hypothetical protein
MPKLLVPSFLQYVRYLLLSGFWSGFLGFEVVEGGAAAGEAVLSCGPGQASLRLVALPQNQTLDRGTACVYH